MAKRSNHGTLRRVDSVVESNDIDEADICSVDKGAAFSLEHEQGVVHLLDVGGHVDR